MSSFPSSSSQLLPSPGTTLTPHQRHFASPIFLFYLVYQITMAVLLSLTSLLTVYKLATGGNVRPILVFAFLLGALYFSWDGRRSWIKRSDARRSLRLEKEEQAESFMAVEESSGYTER